MITSVQNSKVKNIIKLLTKKKERQEQRLFVQRDFVLYKRLRINS